VKKETVLLCVDYGFLLQHSAPNRQAEAPEQTITIFFIQRPSSMEKASIQALYLPFIVTFTIGSRDKVRTSPGYRKFRRLSGKGLSIASLLEKKPVDFD